MRLSLTVSILLAAALPGAAQIVGPRPATVMFSNSGAFVVKVNRESWLRGQAGAATSGWKESFIQTDGNAKPVTKSEEDRWDFSGGIGPEAKPAAAWLAYSQRLTSIGETLQVAWRFQLLRDMELDLLYVSLALPARRFAGKTIRFDTHDMALPERPAPTTQRPITGRPQRVVINSGTLGSIAIRFDKTQVVWVEDLRASGGDSFELRVLLATGNLKAGEEFGLSLQLELAERPELLVGGNGREYQTETRDWTRFDLQDAAKAPLAGDPRQRAPTDASALLHTPAGKFGVLQTRGGHFAWPNGARQRFWGIHLTPAAAPAKEDADAVAARIAQFGINLVRWTVGAPPPNAAELDRLDHFVAALARRGIYAQIVLPTQLPANPAVSSPLIAERLAGLTERSADDWLLRRNTATGKRHADDPALAVVQITTNNLSSQRPASHAPADAEIATGFYRRLYAHLRKIGVKCPIITDDSAPSNPAALVSAGDAIGIGGAWDPLGADGFINNQPMVSSDGGYLPQFAAASVAHKPLLVTRVAHPQWNEFRAEAPLLLAAHAALQDWDGIVWDNFTNDPAIFGQFPVATRLFLGGLVAPARLTTHLMHGDSAGAANPPSLAWLTFISRWRNALTHATTPVPDIVIAADGSEPPKNAPATKPLRLTVKPGGDPAALQRLWVNAARKLRAPLGWEEGPGREFASDNGQLLWDQDHGQFGIMAPACRAAIGSIGGKTVTLGDVTFDVGSPRFAAISLTSLDGNPVAESRRLLLTAVARCENTNQRWFEKLDGGMRVLSAQPGAWIEPIRATVTLLRPRAFKLFALNVAGQRGLELAASRVKDGFTFTVNRESMYYELVSEGGLNLWPF